MFVSHFHYHLTDSHLSVKSLRFFCFLTFIEILVLISLIPASENFLFEMDHPVLHMLMLLLIFSWEYVCLASWTQKRWHHQRHGRCALGRRWCKFVDASQIIFFKMWKPISQRCSRFCWQTKQHNRMVGGLRFLHIVEQAIFIFISFQQRPLPLYVFWNYAD